MHMRLSILFLVTVLTIQFACTLSEAAENLGAQESSMEPVERFKLFLSHRPKVASITWQRQLYPGRVKGSSDLPKEALEPQLLHSRWDSESLFYTQTFAQNKDLDRACPQSGESWRGRWGGVRGEVKNL